MTLKTLNSKLEEYLTQNSQQNFELEIDKIPENLRYIMECYLTKENVNLWLKEKEAFDGKSPIELLSELEFQKLWRNVEKIYATFLYVLDKTYIPDFPNYFDILCQVRQAQYDQLTKV